MTIFRLFIRYLYLGMPLGSAWRIARDMNESRKRWRKMWDKPFDHPERLG